MLVKLGFSVCRHCIDVTVSLDRFWFAGCVSLPEGIWYAGGYVVCAFAVQVALVVNVPWLVC